MPPSHSHWVPDNCENILLISRFFYISDTRQRSVSVVSRFLSEVNIRDRSDFSRESIIARFSFGKNEEVINSIYTLASTRSDSDSTSGSNDNKTYSIAKNVADLKVHVPTVDSCIVITNLGIYKIILRFVKLTYTFYYTIQYTSI